MVKEILSTYQKAFETFLTKTPPRKLLLAYLEDKDNAIIDLEEFVLVNIKKQCNWLTLNAILGSVELMVSEHIELDEEEDTPPHQIGSQLMKAAVKDVVIPKSTKKLINI